LGGLLFGYDWVVIGGAKPFYELYFHLDSPSIEGWAMSCALIGCLVGAVSSGALSNRLGRKRLLTLAALVFAISSLGTGLAAHFSAFVAWRMLGGYAIGLASGISPMYIAEISPAHLRGRLVSLNQLAIVIGILLAQVVNWLIAKAGAAGRNGARDSCVVEWAVGMALDVRGDRHSLPCCFWQRRFWFPKVRAGWPQRAATGRLSQVLERLGGRAYAEQSAGGLCGCQPVRAATLALCASYPRRAWQGPFAGRGAGRSATVVRHQRDLQLRAGDLCRGRIPDIRHPVQHRHHWRGEFSVHAGCAGYHRPLWQALSAALWSLRTGAHLHGSGAFYRLHVQGMPMLVLVLAAMACYSMSLAPVVWVVIAEIFPNRIRGGAMSIAVTALWTACFVLTYTFPVVECGAGHGGRVLDLRGDLHGRLAVSLLSLA
jgi:MFS family permease